VTFTTNYPMDDYQTSIFPRGENAPQQFAIERRFTTIRVAVIAILCAISRGGVGWASSSEPPPGQKYAETTKHINTIIKESYMVLVRVLINTGTCPIIHGASVSAYARSSVLSGTRGNEHRENDKNE
jgi:hypothetical protein